MKKYILSISLVVAFIVVVFAACSKSGGGDAPAPNTPNTPNNPDGPAAATAAVSIKNFAFSPASVTVKAGGVVTWTNDDTAPHTATENNGAFDSKDIAINGKYSYTFPTAGTYTYHCTIHNMMANATVVVK